MTKEKEYSERRQKQRLDEQLDRELEQTFPASDPLTITLYSRKPPAPNADTDDED